MSGNMNLTLKVWRQKNSKSSGKFETYPAKGISPDMSFLEMLDVVKDRKSTRLNSSHSSVSRMPSSA